MNKTLIIPLLLTTFCLYSCDKSPDTASSAGESRNEANRYSLSDLIDMARVEGKTHEPLDALCPRINPHGVLVSDITVGLVSDVGSIDDGTFNQAAFSGMQAAGRCFGVATTFLESAGDDSAAQIQSLINRKVDIIVAVGFQFQEALEDAAAAQQRTKFIGVDQVNRNVLDNFVAISFRDDQVGFIAGAMASLLTQTGTVAVIAGPDSIPPVVAIADGFEAGARHVLPQINVLRRHFNSFNDPQSGVRQAQLFVNEGADVVFGAAGATGTGATLAAAANNAYVIGVDQDEYYTTFKGGTAIGANRLATSAIKRVDLSVFLTIALMAQGALEGGDLEMSVSNGGVSYAPFHKADIPDGVETKINNLLSKLARDEIDISPPSSNSIQQSSYD